MGGEGSGRRKKTEREMLEEALNRQDRHLKLIIALLNEWARTNRYLEYHTMKKHNAEVKRKVVRLKYPIQLG